RSDKAGKDVLSSEVSIVNDLSIGKEDILEVDAQVQGNHISDDGASGGVRHCPGVKCEAAQSISDSAKVEVRIDAQSHDADGAQEVFDKRSQQVSAATSRGGRKNLDEKGGGSNLPYAQSKRAAHAPSVLEPNRGLNWARAVTEGSKPKTNAPRLN
ncbi:hypothetical protein U1Q18_009799, partial [Sarracenia purpurea var. burkii]